MFYHLFNVFLHLTGLYTTNQKKAFFLLLCSIFYYHDIEESERSLLLNYCNEFDGKSELDWASDFVKSDILTALKRSRTIVSDILEVESSKDKVEVLSKVWEATKTKGYITQIEANLLLGVSRDWNVESQLIDIVKSN